jgi:ADP-heptose:LPS heptosyltransferase
MTGRVYSHGGSAGDVIYHMAPIKDLGGGALYLNTQGPPAFRMTRARIESLLTLIRVQPYIEYVGICDAPVGFNLDLWQQNWRHGLNLSDMLSEMLGIPHTSRTEPWLSVPEKIEVAAVVLHRSPRYHAEQFPWRRVLEVYGHDAVFVGDEAEHRSFTAQFGLVRHHRTDSYLELAQVISGALLFVGNQSSPAAIAEGLKVNKILEAVPRDHWAWNCHWERPGVIHGYDGTVELPPLSQWAARTSSGPDALRSTATKARSRSNQRETLISFSFHHGLGDCSNAAHLLALYTRRGFEIEVECRPDKSWLFEAAGCRSVPRAREVHHWDHAGAAGRPLHHDHWSGNKTAWNLSRNPLPHIGEIAELWDELCSTKLDLDRFLTPEIEREIDRYVRTLPRPLILFAPQGDTATDRKNLDHATQGEILRGLLDQTDGTIIQLDWHQRVLKLPSWRIRHLGDDWRPLTTLELYALIRRADLVIGCDSGVLHFSRFTETPALGAWTRHDPSQFALPRRNTLHVVSQSRNELTRYRRIAYNLVECTGDRLSGSFIAEQASRLLGGRKFIQACVPDTVLRHLLDNCRRFESPMTSYVDRHRTFDAFLSQARRKANPLFVETGCIRSAEDWSAGYSTYLFGYFLQEHGGQLESVDSDPAHVEIARAWTAAYGSTVRIHHSLSHDWLRSYTGPPIDLLYLDSADVGSPQHRECCLGEAQLALPHLAHDALILVDDACWKAGSFQGNGELSVPWLLERGWSILTAGYQVLLEQGNGV